MILGIAGTAKNTGKTTTTNAIIDKLSQVNLRVGLTSIGYDGEDIDHVTDLPKPRVNLEAGSLVAVAEACIKGSKASLKVLEVTDIRTPLGKVVIAEVLLAGRVVIAGPNKAKDLRVVLARLQAYGAKLILVDGALNRLAPMVAADGLILATGAARTPDIEKLALETKAIYEILNLPLTSESDSLSEESGIVVQGESEVKLTMGSLLLVSAVEELLNLVSAKTGKIYIPGVVEEKALQGLAQGLVRQGFEGELILHDPIKILVGGNPLVLKEALAELARVGIAVRVCSALPLCLITVNPFYPRYRVQYHNYQPDYVDAELLQASIQEQVPIQVLNVVKDGFDLQWITNGRLSC